MALARQWMKFIVVTQGFKAIGLMRPNQLPKPKETPLQQTYQVQGLDNGAALQSDTSADGAEFEFDAGRNFFPEFFIFVEYSGKSIHDRETYRNNCTEKSPHMLIHLMMGMTIMHVVCWSNGLYHVVNAV